VIGPLVADRAQSLDFPAKPHALQFGLQDLLPHPQTQANLTHVHGVPPPQKALDASRQEFRFRRLVSKRKRLHRCSSFRLSETH
jgi:hypothetical protein